MNRDRLILPSWASPETAQSLARDLALWVGRELLVDGGAGGWDWTLNAQLRAHASPLVAEVAATMPRGRNWSPHRVATAVCEALDLAGAAFSVAERLRSLPIEQSAKLDPTDPEKS